MRRANVLILSLMAVAAVCKAQEPIGLTMAGVDPAVREAEGLQAQDLFAPLGLQNNVPGTPIAEAITPDLQALARDLENDPVRIFNFVHDHIRHVLYFGSKKGAELTLLEKSGNDFDQCALLVALLRAAGYSNAAYEFGWMKLPYDSPDHNDLHHWLELNVATTLWSYRSNYLDTLVRVYRGYPATAAIWGTNVFAFQRVWVTLSIGSTNYFLDPSFKVSEPVTGVNLLSATKFSRSALMNVAGGTDTSDYVTGLSEASIRNTLTAYTTNLLDYIQTTCPNGSVAQVLGGWQIVPATNTTLSRALLFDTYDWGGTMPLLDWANEPTNLMSALTIGFAGTNWYQCYVPELQGQRLTATFDTHGLAQLWLDDTNKAQAQTAGTGWSDLELTVNHPVGHWDTNNNLFVNGATFDQSSTNYYTNYSSTYCLGYAFEPDWGWLRLRQDKLDAYRQQGYSDNSRQVVSETMNVMSLSYALQSAYCIQALAAQAGMLHQTYHSIGRLSQEPGAGYYFDYFLWQPGDYSNAGLYGGDELANYLAVSSYFGSALEHGVIEQLQASNLVAASTVKMLEIASTNGQAIYLASSNNWQKGAQVRANLTGYSSSDLSTLDNLISLGDILLLPRCGSNSVDGPGSWSGCGYVDHHGPGSCGMFIHGIYGGQVSSGSATVNPPYVVFFGHEQPLPGAFQFRLTAGDPVDTTTGGFQVGRTDLSVGQPEPHGITFATYYNSVGRHVSSAGMAPGWLHNYCVSAQPVAAPQASLGITTPAQMAPILAATCAALGMYNDPRPDPRNWTMTALIAKWGADQLNKRGVSVQMGKDLFQFVQQPDGRFVAPANCTWTLSDSGTYVLQQRRGNTFSFDALGRLSSIADPYAPYTDPLSVTYNASNWVSTVTDWRGRSLTFSYTGTPQRLTSVTDDTGSRSVGYGYTGTDLTWVTDPEGKISRFFYDSDHQLTYTRDARNQLVTTNIYDGSGSGRVNTQYVEGNPGKAWQIYWSGWETVVQDPAGGKQHFLYDDDSRLIAFEDALGNLSQTFYDGQDHAVLTISPIGETNQFVFDGNHNLLVSVDALGGSNQFVYDAQYDLSQSVDARGNTNRFGYDSHFSLTGSTNGAGDWTTYSYNTDGTRHQRTDAGGTTIYGYDSYGQLHTVTYPGGLGSETFVFNPEGDLTSHSDGRGFATTFGYNSRRQLTNTVAPTNLTSTVAYDAIGNQQSVTDGRGFTTASYWDAVRHLIATVFPSTPQGAPAITNLYDNRDWLSSTLDPLRNHTLLTNDLAGRLLSRTDPLLRTTRLGHDPDGRRIATTNAAQEVTLERWDGRGLETNWVDAAHYTVQRSFDEAGNPITLTNRLGKGWVFGFDAANRLTNTITPLGRQTWQFWNNRGLPFAFRDPMNQWTTNFYDARARRTNVTDALGVRLYGFDGNNNLTNLTQTINTQQSTLNFTYDAYDRVSSYQDADGNLIQYRYDASGNLTNLVYPGNRNVYYAFDTLNRMTNVTDWAQRQTRITYDLASRVTSITRPNNTVRQIAYDADGEVTNIVEKTTTGYPVAFFTLGWTNSGRVGWEFAAPLPHAYTPPYRSMAYNNDNQISTLNGTNTLGYDLDGNMTSGPLTNNALVTYTYDARNRLSAIGNVQYGYDPAGSRTSITNGAGVTRFVVNPNARLPQVLIRTKPDGSQTLYVYGPGLLYEVDLSPNGTELYTRTYHYDVRGSTVALTDGNGLPTDRVEYSAYGMTTYRTGTSDTPFLYNGRYGVMTDANGLLYMRARYYNPYLCRFINPDPAGFAGGLNFYCYADGNPISLNDPFGLCPSDFDTGHAWLDSTIDTAAKAGEGALGLVAQGTLGALRGVGAALEFADQASRQPGGGLDPGAAALPLLLCLASDGASSLLRTAATGEGVAAAEGTGAFNTAFSGGGDGLGSLLGKEIRVSQRGLDLVENHLAQFGDVEENTMMLDRLRGALANGQTISGGDASFYLHEASEATMMGRGMSYDAAHAAALQKYGVSPFSVYSPQVIQALPGSFNQNWFNFWGISGQ